MSSARPIPGSDKSKPNGHKPFVGREAIIEYIQARMKNSKLLYKEKIDEKETPKELDLKEAAKHLVEHVINDCIDIVAVFPKKDEISLKVAIHYQGMLFDSMVALANKLAKGSDYSLENVYHTRVGLVRKEAPKKEGDKKEEEKPKETDVKKEGSAKEGIPHKKVNKKDKNKVKGLRKTRLLDMSVQQEEEKPQKTRKSSESVAVSNRPSSASANSSASLETGEACSGKVPSKQVDLNGADVFYPQCAPRLDSIILPKAAKPEQEWKKDKADPDNNVMTTTSYLLEEKVKEIRYYHPGYDNIFAPQAQREAIGKEVEKEWKERWNGLYDESGQNFVKPQYQYLSFDDFKKTPSYEKAVKIVNQAMNEDEKICLAVATDVENYLRRMFQIKISDLVPVSPPRVPSPSSPSSNSSLDTASATGSSPPSGAAVVAGSPEAATPPLSGSHSGSRSGSPIPTSGSSASSSPNREGYGYAPTRTASAPAAATTANLQVSLRAANVAADTKAAAAPTSPASPRNGKPNKPNVLQNMRAKALITAILKEYDQTTVEMMIDECNEKKWDLETVNSMIIDFHTELLKKMKQEVMAADEFEKQKRAMSDNVDKLISAISSCPEIVKIAEQRYPSLSRYNLFVETKTRTSPLQKPLPAPTPAAALEAGM